MDQDRFLLPELTPRPFRFLDLKNDELAMLQLQIQDRLLNRFKTVSEMLGHCFADVPSRIKFPVDVPLNSLNEPHSPSAKVSVSELLRC